jgi:limonene-1,2-epoxide hydrolase
MPAIRAGRVRGRQDFGKIEIIVDLVGGRIASWREYFDFGNSIDAKP